MRLPLRLRTTDDDDDGSCHIHTDEWPKYTEVGVSVLFPFCKKQTEMIKDPLVSLGLWRQKKTLLIRSVLCAHTTLTVDYRVNNVRRTPRELWIKVGIRCVFVSLSLNWRYICVDHSLWQIFRWGGRFLDEQWAITKRTPNVRIVQTANTRRIHSVLISTLPHAQNLEHVQNNQRSLANYDDHWKNS